MKTGLIVVAVLLVALSAVVGASVILQDSGADDGGAAPDSRIANIDQFDPYKYAEYWQGDPSLRHRPMSTIGIDEWARIVRRYRDGGLGSLDEGDRILLLQGSAKAYLRAVTSTRRVIDVDGGGWAEVIEEYDRTLGGDDTAIKWLEFRAHDIVPEPADLVDRKAGDHREKMLLVKISAQDWAFVYWQLDLNGRWSCESSIDDGTSVAFTAPIYYVNLLAPVAGKWTGEETVSGRRALLFEMVEEGSLTRVWLDARTLFPLKYEYPSWNSAGAPPEAELPARTVHITGFNVIKDELKPTGCSDAPPERLTTQE